MSPVLPNDGKPLLKIRQFARDVLLWQDCSWDETQAFSRYGKAFCVRATEIGCWAFICVSPAYFVIDVLSLHANAAIFASATWRLGTGAILLVGALTARSMRRSGRDKLAYPLGIGGGALMAGIIGWSTADTTHLGSVTTAAFLLIPLLSIPAILPLGLRMIATILATAALVGGFVYGDPRHIEEPHFFYFLSVMGFACFLSISFGHALTHTLRDRFLVSQRLSELAQSLEARVAERSRELHSLFDHIELAREQERTRIACEMHDELGQLLSASALSMDRALGQSASSVHPLSDELARARALVGDSISFVRALLHQTQPLLLNERGLLGAIEMLLAEHERTANVDCLWSIEMDTSEFLPEEKLAVFRVLQECLRNSARHAKAKRVEVLLARDGQNVVLTVRDDGVGFRMDSRREGAFGIGGMQQRAKALGGELIVQSAIDRGTKITFRFVAEKST